jgi:regulator of extracellular matrix RemA (YlzA/DUF370 family)
MKIPRRRWKPRRARRWAHAVGGQMDQTLLNIGFGSTVVSDRVVAIVSPNSAPMKRLKDEAREDRRLIDATHGRRTRSIIILDSNHVVLSAIQAETISQRYAVLKEAVDPAVAPEPL